MTSVAVRCDALTKEYKTDSGSVMALRGVDLSISSGELFMIVGPSGCGKTTLISIIASILNPSSGSCEILGENPTLMRPKEKIAFRKKHVGFVFQSFNLLPTITAAENVAVPLMLQGMSVSKATAKATEMLGRLGLGDRGGSRPSQLSGGQQQRVAIARALIHDPSIVVCDEPTSALDHDTGQKIMELMREVALEQSRTLIIVTHDNRIFSYADRIATMDDGRVTRIINPKQEKLYPEMEHAA